LSLDWRRLKAVVIESDDWGFCAWSPDEDAYRALSETPAYRTPAGRRYGGSTLESAADVRSMIAIFAECTGGDGRPAVCQANTVMSAPDYERMKPPRFECDAMPVMDLPETPSRWRRPGLWEAVTEARESAVWRLELHAHHHLPESAWLAALRRGEGDARRAYEHQSPICVAVEASGEYDPSEPAATRARNLESAVRKFRDLAGRAPESFCPPDYRWDDSLETHAERLGVTTIQGKAEQVGGRFPKLRHLWLRRRWPHRLGSRFYMPARVAFEPGRMERGSEARAVESARRAVRLSWSRGQPAIVSTHRVNYVHLDPARAAAGRGALRDLLRDLAADGASFLVDAEVRQLEERGWSVRDLGSRAALLRRHDDAGAPPRFAAPAGVLSAAVRSSSGSGAAEVILDRGEVVARVGLGAHVIEWSA
jgi:hypothetical protein